MGRKRGLHYKVKSDKCLLRRTTAADSKFVAKFGIEGGDSLSNANISRQKLIMDLSHAHTY